MDLTFYLTILLLTGLFVGFASGLLGVGGGFIMGPVQFFLLTAIGVDATIAIRVAFGTSLAVILPTAFSGAIGHRRKGAVLLRPAILLGLTGFIGGVIGALMATNAPAEILRIISGIVILLTAIWMIKGHNQVNEGKISHPDYLYLFWGFIGGLSSGILGIGGGVIIVPVLTILLRFDIHKAIGTSTVFILIASLGGVMIYILQGLNVTGLPPYSWGYINIVQLVALSITSIPLAQLGVRVAHKVPERELRYIFVALLVFVALKMIGVFEWLNLPL
jgi:uncharacterized membrane protein YfcA